MKDFEEMEKLEKFRELEAEAAVDDDGFTMVNSRNKRKKSNDDSKNNKSNKGRKRTRKNAGTAGSNELKDFYRFQVREQKRDTLLSLREKFAKDQEKIASLKAARKFNPF